MIREEVITEWNSLKEIILSHLDTHQLVKEQIMENYDKKLKTKETLIEELETDYKDLASKYKKLTEKTNTMVNKEDYAVLEKEVISLKNKIDSFTFDDNSDGPTIEEVD